MLRSATTNYPSFFALFLTLLGSLPELVWGAPVPPDLQGIWKSDACPCLLRVTEKQVVEWADNRLTVKGIEKYEPGRLTVRNSGLKETWLATAENGLLRFERAKQTQIYHRLDTSPPELELEPLPLGPTRELPLEKRLAIQRELEERIKKDQAVRLDPSQTPRMSEVDADNTRFLKGIVQEIGWIDVARFGEQASHQAFILVQHSRDLRLMMAVLPPLEKDFKRSEYAQDYALLYDRLQLRMGRKQRYGTQIGEDANGNPFVKPLEDPERVDLHWKELGLPPLSAYLADASKILFNGKPIRMPRSDE